MDKLLEHILTRLFSEKNRGIAIALASSLSSACKNYDILSYVCHYLTYKLQSQKYRFNKGDNSKYNFARIMSLFGLINFE